MSTHPGSEPTWYHRTVDAEPSAFAGAAAPADRPGADRKVKAMAAAFIVVILCALGVSVAALTGEPAEDAAPAGTTERHDRSEPADEQADQKVDEKADEQAGLTGEDVDLHAEEIDELKLPKPTTTAAPKPNTTAPKPTTTAPKPTTTTAPKPTTTTAPPTTTSTTTAKGPEVLSVTAPSSYACSEAPEFESPNTVTVKWTTKNATSVSIAIDSPTGVYQSGLPANGQMDLPAPCHGDTQTYYVIAVGDGGTTATKSATTTGI